MPKGDRLKLKADPEDGTTPVANLLLEAVAMAKISGLQKGAIIYLWRATYGWVDESGKRKKEAKIPLAEWGKALDSTSGRLSHALSELETKCIIKRRMADAWGGYFYSLNTNISKWNSNSINLSKLAERVGVPDFATVDYNATITQNATVDQTDNSCENDNSCQKDSATVTQNATLGLPKTQLPTLYKESIKKDIKKEADNKLSSPFGIKTKEVFARIDELRGYKPPKRSAEASSILRMLKKDYTPNQIIETWQELKQDKFWVDKELVMMTVESQIGAKLKHKEYKQNDEPKPSKYQGMVKS